MKKEENEEKNEIKIESRMLHNNFFFFLNSMKYINLYFSAYNIMDTPAGSLTPGMDDKRKTSFSGFSCRKDSDSEEDELKPLARIPGAAIAPPLSLQESFVSPPGPHQSSGIGMGMGVAAKIMAKYGFKVIKCVFIKGKL